MNPLNYINKHKNLVLSLVIFALSLTLGMWNLNKIGRVWDEEFLLQLSYRHVELARNLDFNNTFWWRESIPDHPPLVRYLRGIASLPDIESFDLSGRPVFKYELTFNRLLSVILMALSAVLVYLIGAKYISKYSGFVAGIILTMLPIPLGHSQIGMLEPLGLFFFTASIYTFLLFLEKPTSKMVTLSGIALGFAFLARETHLMLIPMMFIIIFLKRRFGPKVSKKISSSLIKKTFIIFAISIILFIVLWPWPFLHLDYMIEFTWKIRVSETGSIPEVFFGRLMLVPKIYYITHFLITTPLVILILALIGLKKVDRSKKWVLYTIVIWLVFPFLMSFYPKKEQGIRYIIQICAPLALLAALGFETMVNKLTKNQLLKYLAIIPLFIYSFIILVRITPYYTNYFNILVGGARGVYEKELFHLAWWGEGSLEAMHYLINNAPKGSRVGLATSPLHTFPPLRGSTVEEYKSDQEYDYVIVNFYHIHRIGFDDSGVRRNYKHVFSVMADGAPIYKIYKKLK